MYNVYFYSLVKKLLFCIIPIVNGLLLKFAKRWKLPSIGVYGPPENSWKAKRACCGDYQQSSSWTYSLVEQDGC